MPKKLYLILGVAVMVGWFSSTASARPMATSPRIDQDLWDTLESGGTANFFVKMAMEADLTSAYDMTDWNARGTYVYGALQEVAQRTQGPVIAVARRYGLDYTSFLSTNSVYVRGGTLQAALDLEALPGVAYLRAEKILEIPDEPEAAKATASGAGLPTAIMDWGITDTKADQVWSQHGVRGDGIIVASIDSGADHTHAALQPNYRCGAGPHAACWLDPGTTDCQGPGGGPCDTPSPTGGYHGTSTTATIAAVDDPNLAYIVGMAPSAKWIACLGCPFRSCPDYDLNACADWILAPGGDPANRPHVVNNSWGRKGGDPWYLSEVNAWRAAGIFPSFAAGNSGSSCNSLASPADYQESFASAAHGVGRSLGSFSSRGPSHYGHEPYTKPNISAPGVNIVSARPGNQWEAKSGTSMASPHVAGAVALVWSACPAYAGKVDLTAALLQNAADAAPAGDCSAPPDGEGTYAFGYGYLNVNAAVTQCESMVAFGTLAGHIMDAWGNPIQAALVVAKPAQGGSGIGAATDSNGYYSMELVPQIYTLTATKSAYAPQSISSIEIGANQIAVQDITLTSLSQWRPGTSTAFDLTSFDGAYSTSERLIFFLGGRDGPATHDRNIYAYDPATGVTVDTNVDMLYNAADITIAVVEDDGTDRGEAFYVVGGRDVSSGAYIRSVQRFYPGLHLVEEVTTDPFPDTVSGQVVGAGGVSVAGDKIYVFGGWQDMAAPYFSTRTWMFDPKAPAGSRWTDLGCSLSPGRSHMITAESGGKIYALGGIYQYVPDPADRVPTDVVQVLDTTDPGTCWQAIAPLPAPTAEGRGFGFDPGSLGPSGMVYAVAGGDWPYVSGTVYAYDIATQAWSTNFSPLALARRGHAGVFVSDYTVDPSDGLPGMWVFGGSLGGDSPPYAEPEYWPFVPPVGTLEGQVTDTAGDPVEGAIVSAEAASAQIGTQATTDPGGHYKIVLQPGTYTVSAQKEGYATTAIPGVVVTIGQTAVQDLTLTELSVPDAHFSAEPTSGPATLIVQFSDESTGVITSWLWDFGDGQLGTAPNPTHGYAQPGTYPVSLTVSGPGGTDTSTRDNYITVYDRAVAQFSGGPTSGFKPLTVTFANHSIGDFDTCSWIFGDGQTGSGCAGPVHVYTSPGSHTVSLTVSGLGGADTQTRTDYITVIQGQAHVSSVGLAYRLQSGKYVVSAAVGIVNQFAQPIGGAMVSATWTLPNGSHPSQQALSNTSGIARFSFMSALAGTYEICVTGVAKAGWEYRPEQNVETCEQITVP